MQLKNSLIKKIKIPKISDDCFLYFIQYPNYLPFEIKRVFYITSANTKLPRGLHAHKKTQQVLFCIQGTIKLILDNGKKRSQITLNKPNIGIFIDKMIWSEMHNFKRNTILLILASDIFKSADYLRDYGQFKKKARLS